MQDLLSLGNEARMNLPGVADGNWNWRMLPEQLTSLAGDTGQKLHQFCRLYDRLPVGTSIVKNPAHGILFQDFHLWYLPQVVKNRPLVAIAQTTQS
jgi:hypothetical protein